jgi:hypothetical protein
MDMEMEKLLVVKCPPLPQWFLITSFSTVLLTPSSFYLVEIEAGVSTAIILAILPVGRKPVYASFLHDSGKCVPTTLSYTLGACEQSGPVADKHCCQQAKMHQLGKERTLSPLSQSTFQPGRRCSRWRRWRRRTCQPRRHRTRC